MIRYRSVHTYESISAAEFRWNQVALPERWWKRTLKLWCGWNWDEVIQQLESGVWKHQHRDVMVCDLEDGAYARWHCDTIAHYLEDSTYQKWQKLVCPCRRPLPKPSLHSSSKERLTEHRAAIVNTNELVAWALQCQNFVRRGWQCTGVCVTTKVIMNKSNHKEEESQTKTITNEGNHRRRQWWRETKKVSITKDARHRQNQERQQRQ